MPMSEAWEADDDRHADGPRSMNVALDIDGTITAMPSFEPEATGALCKTLHLGASERERLGRVRIKQVAFSFDGHLTPLFAGCYAGKVCRCPLACSLGAYPWGGQKLNWKRQGVPKGVGPCPFPYIRGFPGGQWRQENPAARRAPS
jgi:hypothetical protein